MLAGQCASNITHEPVAKRGAAGSARWPSTTPGAFGGTGTVRPGEESGFKIAGAGSGAICPFPGALAAKRGCATSVQERPSIAAVYTCLARLRCASRFSKKGQTLFQTGSTFIERRRLLVFLLVFLNSKSYSKNNTV